MNSKKISIIIPIYNCEKYIARCLDSIIAQEHEHFEAILVDDGSTDGSAQICREYEKRDNRFIYIYKDNGGVSSARNVGLDRASGELVAFVDGDDEILPDMLSSLVRIMDESGADVSVISPIIRINGKDVPFKDDATVLTLSRVDAIKEALRGVVFAGHLCTKLFKAHILKDIRLREDFAICEDLVAVYEAFSKCDSVAFANLYKYVYYTNASSAINSTFKESFLSYIDATEYLLECTERDYPEIKDYATSALVNAHIDVINKLYYAKRLSKELFAKYRARLREIATKNVLSLMPRYKRIIVRSMKGSRFGYALTIRTFNLMKKIAYALRNK